jgi:hypothetical protein
VNRDSVHIIDRLVKTPSPRKTPLPRGRQWVHHEKPGSQAARRRLRQAHNTDGKDASS